MVAQWRRIKESWAEERVAVTGIEPAGEASLADMRWELRGRGERRTARGPGLDPL